MLNFEKHRRETDDAAYPRARCGFTRLCVCVWCCVVGWVVSRWFSCFASRPGDACFPLPRKEEDAPRS